MDESDIAITSISDSLIQVVRAQQIQHRQQENPDDIDKVPVERAVRRPGHSIAARKISPGSTAMITTATMPSVTCKA